MSDLSSSSKVGTEVGEFGRSQKVAIPKMTVKSPSCAPMNGRQLEQKNMRVTYQNE